MGANRLTSFEGWSGLFDRSGIEPLASDLGALGQSERILDVDAEVRTVLSILVWPRRICTARKLPVRL